MMNMMAIYDKTMGTVEVKYANGIERFLLELLGGEGLVRDDYNELFNMIYASLSKYFTKEKPLLGDPENWKLLCREYVFNRIPNEWNLEHEEEEYVECFSEKWEENKEEIFEELRKEKIDQFFRVGGEYRCLEKQMAGEDICASYEQSMKSILQKEITHYLEQDQAKENYWGKIMKRYNVKADVFEGEEGSALECEMTLTGGSVDQAVFSYMNTVDTPYEEMGKDLLKWILKEEHGKPLFSDEIAPYHYPYFLEKGILFTDFPWSMEENMDAIVWRIQQNESLEAYAVWRDYENHEMIYMAGLTNEEGEKLQDEITPYGGMTCDIWADKFLELMEQWDMWELKEKLYGLLSYIEEEEDEEDKETFYTSLIRK